MKGCVAVMVGAMSALNSLGVRFREVGVAVVRCLSVWRMVCQRVMSCLVCWHACLVVSVRLCALHQALLFFLIPSSLPLPVFSVECSRFPAGPAGVSPLKAATKRLTTDRETNTDLTRPMWNQK